MTLLMAPTAPFHTLQAGALYALTVSGAYVDAAVNLSLEASDQTWHMALPVDEVRTFFITTPQPVRVSCPAGVTVTCVAAGLLARLRVAGLYFMHTKRSVLRLAAPAGLTLYPVPDSPRLAKLFRRSLNICRLLDISPERSYSPAQQHMVTGRPAPAVVGPQVSTAERIAIVLHLHYVELWPEFAGYLAHIPPSVALIVTLTADDPDLIADIVRRFPQADVHVMANFGRDLGPFLALLDQGAFEPFDYVCKLHGKKSVRKGRATLLGDLWRRRSVVELLGCGKQMDAILARFQAMPTLGLMGVEAFRIPNARFSAHDAWGGNHAVTLELARRIHGEPVAAASFPLDFFAGTMFWFRPQALKPLRGLGLGQPEAYAAEAGHTDGALEHGLERIIPYAVRRAGFTVASVPAMG